MRFSSFILQFLAVMTALAVVLPNSHAADKLVVALKPDKDPDTMLEERAALGEFLSSVMDREADVIVPLSGSVILEGFTNGSVDVGWLSGADLIIARDRGVAELLLAGEINGNPWYTSYWVCLADADYKDVSSLQGKPVAFSSRTSTSGFVVPYWNLVKLGHLERGDSPEEFFGKGNVFYGTGYVSAVERVLSGDAEAAAVSYYVLDEDRHLKPEQKSRLRMLASQGPVPTHVLAVRKSLPDAERARLREVFLTLNEEKNTELRDKVFTSRLIEVDEAKHLESLTEAMDLVKAIQ